jgi:hypothetical protein
MKRGARIFIVKSHKGKRLMRGLEVAALHSNSPGKIDDYFANRLSRFTLRRPIGENISPLKTGRPTFLSERAKKENHMAPHSNRACCNSIRYAGRDIVRREAVLQAGEQRYSH